MRMVRISGVSSNTASTGDCTGPAGLRGAAEAGAAWAIARAGAGAGVTTRRGPDARRSPTSFPEAANQTRCAAAPIARSRGEAQIHGVAAKPAETAARSQPRAAVEAWCFRMSASATWAVEAAARREDGPGRSQLIPVERAPALSPRLVPACCSSPGSRLTATAPVPAR